MSERMQIHFQLTIKERYTERLNLNIEETVPTGENPASYLLDRLGRELRAWLNRNLDLINEDPALPEFILTDEGFRVKLPEVIEAERE